MWYDNEISMGIMTKKYLHPGEKPEDLIPRVVSIFSDDLKPKAKKVLDNADFLPAGRTLFGAGKKGKRKLSISNCYICDVEDSIESIFETAKQIARISSYGGGSGLALDKLRPKGSLVNNSAMTSTGAVSFLNIFDVTGTTIGQNGRRAALMICLRCNHPDIEEFLKIKQNNEKLASMNISIKFTDEFMKAVENNQRYTLYFESEETGRIEKVINARDFFIEFCKTQYSWGDPGAIFIDRVRSYQTLSGYPEYEIYTSNPCLAGYTRILTDQGYFPIETLVDQEVNVWNGYQYSKVIPKITGHNQKMIRVSFSNGVSLDCTLYHQFIMEDGSRKEAKNLIIGDKLCKWSLPDKDYYNSATVTDINELPDAETVYCLNEPFNHSFVAEGILTGNCSEIFGITGTSCNLGSINIYNMIDNKFTDQASINYEKLQEVTDIGIRMLDEILDYGRDMQPLELNKKIIDDWRSIGLGIFGIADAFVALGVKYGSPKSQGIAKQIMKTILHQAILTSSLIAKEKGSFGKFDVEKTLKSPIFQLFPDLHETIRANGLRNGTFLSIAPTGTISLFAGKFTGGLEPMFKIAYTRTSHSMEDSKKTFTVYARGVEDLLKYHGCEDLTPEEAKKRFPFLVESHEVPYMDRVRFQGVLQTYVDNAISSTVNLPNSATVEDIFNIYMEAWKCGVKGITIFRDGCKRGNILGVDNKSKDGEVPDFDTIDPPSRSEMKIIDGTTVRECTSCVKALYVTVNKTPEGKAFEIFTNASGGCKTNINTISRLVSLALRSGVKVDRIVEELRANQCPACQLIRKQDKKVALSCSNAIANAIEAAMKREVKSTKQTIENETTKDSPTIKRACPECGERTLIPEGKCVTCSNCGWSKCE